MVRIIVYGSIIIMLRVSYGVGTDCTVGVAQNQHTDRWNQRPTQRQSCRLPWLHLYAVIKSTSLQRILEYTSHDLLYVPTNGASTSEYNSATFMIVYQGIMTAVCCGQVPMVMVGGMKPPSIHCDKTYPTVHAVDHKSMFGRLIPIVLYLLPITYLSNDVRLGPFEPVCNCAENNLSFD